MGMVLQFIPSDTYARRRLAHQPHTETHAGAGPSGTNVPSSSTTWSEIDWLNSAWSTPGEKIYVWPAYAGSEDITVTEIATACEIPTSNLHIDWIEFYNHGTSTST